MSAVISSGAVIGLLAVAVFLFRRWQRERHFVWRMDSISASVLRYEGNILSGPYLNLDQKLRPGESGWANMKIDIPENWVVESTTVADFDVVISLSGGQTYVVNRRNVGPLSFDVLNGGPGKASEILERIWNKHAKSKQA